jgi:hypothetical protein
MAVAIVVLAVLYSYLLRLRYRGGFGWDGFRNVGFLLFVTIRLEFDGFGLGFGGFGRFGRRGGEQ